MRMSYRGSPRGGYFAVCTNQIKFDGAHSGETVECGGYRFLLVKLDSGALVAQCDDCSHEWPITAVAPGLTEIWK